MHGRIRFALITFSYACFLLASMRAAAQDIGGDAARETKGTSARGPKQSGRPEAGGKDGGSKGGGGEKASESVTAPGGPLKLTYEQITFGDKHHFFGYIGQSLTIPWNASQRYIVALESDFHDHMPRPKDAARVIIIDTENDCKIEYLDETRGWNIQQGTMLYWNPEAPETQFIFNDRDSDGKVFAVLYDTEERKRIREFKFADTPIGNGGVAPGGGYFLGINYARMARLRSVTGYPEAHDWTVGELAPKDDGIFLVNINTGKKELLVSFFQLAEYLGNDDAAFYINHTLWNRESERIYFYARGRIGDSAMKINKPFSMLRDGSQLTNHDYIGGHPEWGVGDTVIGARGGRQVLYDVVQRKAVGEIGNAEIWKKAGGDISLSPNAKMFVNGSAGNKYIVYRIRDGEYVESKKFSRGDFSSGDLRIDPAPRWNRKSNAILVSQWVDDARQLFIIHVAGAPVDP